MADTLEEALNLLGAGNESNIDSYLEEVLTIDNDLRHIQVPDGFTVGVYNDKNVYGVNFVMPRFYRGIDLSEFNIQINYVSANDVGNIFEVESPTVNTDTIEFTWLLDRGVFLTAGTVRFIVCLRQIGEDGAVLKEFNTTIAYATVLKGLEIEDPNDPESYSLLAHMKQIEERMVRQGEIIFASYSDIRGMQDELDAKLQASPRFAPTASAMTDITSLYIYTGSESGYIFGAWYYYDTENEVWTLYVNANVDTTLSISGVPADAAAVGSALDLKANASEMNVAFTRKLNISDYEEDMAEIEESISGIQGDISDIESAITQLNTDVAQASIGLRTRIAVGSTYDALKVKSFEEADEQKFFFYGIGANAKTIIFELYFRGSNNTIVLQNLGELVVQAVRDDTDHDTVVITIGIYGSGVLLSYQSNITISYATTGTTLTSNSIAGVGDGTTIGAISKLNTRFTYDHWISNVDLNDLTSDGYYWLSTGITNGPTATPWGPLRVISDTNAGTIRQILYATGGKIWYRNRQSSTWGDWTSIINSGPSSYTSNADADNFTTAGYYHVGITTNSPLGDSAFYGVLIVTTGGSGHCQQLAIAAHNGLLYGRGRNNSSSSWSTWHRFMNESYANSVTTISASIYDERVENFLNTSATSINFSQNGKMVVAPFKVTYKKAVTASQTTILDVTATHAPSVATYFTAVRVSDGRCFIGTVATNGYLNVENNGLISVGDVLNGTAIWIHK